MSAETYTPLGPGDRAPDFTLPVVNGEGVVSLHTIETTAPGSRARPSSWPRSGR
jgi:hypothetical protein